MAYRTGLVDDDNEDDDDDGDVDDADYNNDDNEDSVDDVNDDDGLPQRKRPRLPSPLSCYALLPSLVLSVMMMSLVFLILESMYI